MNNLYIELARQTLMLALLLSAPALVVSLAIGTLISLFQALTQLQEQTLTFVPKILVTFIILILTSGWMLHKMMTFFERTFEAILRVGQAG
jgi:flagellar biosynthesis protein FliQ